MKPRRCGRCEGKRFVPVIDGRAATWEETRPQHAAHIPPAASTVRPCPVCRPSQAVTQAGAA